MSSVIVEIDNGGRPEHLKGIGDCSVRALAKFLDEPYAEVERLLRLDVNYAPERGVLNLSFYPFLRKLGLTQTTTRVRLTAKNARERLPQRCILLFRNHVAFYEDGIVYDAFYTTDVPGCKQIRGYFA